MTCDDYFRDPEANAAHLQECALCRAMAEELDGEIEVQPHVPIDLDALPVAAWEGASHRTWPLVAAGFAAVLVLATVLFFASGNSTPVEVFHAVATGLPPVDAVVRVLQLTGRGLGLPLVAILFLVINSILFLLLRRSPKGMDV
jgi:hypothetical protein